MPSSENQGFSSRIPFPSFRRGIFTIRSDQIQIHSVENEQGGSSSQGSELRSFQRLVSSRFSDLSVANGEEFLSVSWVRKLLDAFGDCQDEFRAVLSSSKEFVSKQPQDKILSDYFDMNIKALDICNATRDGVQKIRSWQRHLEIVVSALDPPQQRMRRARKALMDLSLDMLDEKDTGGSVFSIRNRSFGHHNRTKDSPRHSRSLSWSVSPSWSASKQLQLIANGLALPNAATNGLATLVFTMSHVLLFVLWAVVAAIPCQDRGLQTNITIPTLFPWSRSLQTLHSRITEESKKRGRSSNGLLRETHLVEKGVHRLTELIDSPQLPLSEEHKEDMRESVETLSRVSKTYQTELGPLEHQLREVFRKIRSCRAEGLEFLANAHS
ncbi:PREDICTED: uncharacterized protein LOC109169103 [Ipomoea nil]|uniref:uncharacterized protein LOC109169103 n=1 Tax=Ipomoea nil TaxID=35883 RepID=UPI00090196DD|nr:PREDICTED: uncharacterized protein LOC109169103 [Ipomoea nil]